MKSKKAGRNTRPPSPVARIATDRNTARAFVRLPVRITIESTPEKQHVGFVRDISPRGMFFYSDFVVSAGEPIALILEYPHDDENVRLEVNGKVLRVEQGASKEVVGVAVAFDCQHPDVPRTPLSPKRQRRL